MDMIEETNPYEEVEKELDLYDPTSRSDIVSIARSRVIENFGQRSNVYMIMYYASKIGRISTYCDDLKEKLDKLIADPETSIFNGHRLNYETYFQYWALLEESGERFDEHGQLRKRFDQQAMLDAIANKNKSHNYFIFHDFIDTLFKPGNDNIVYGRKGDGKSNYLLNLGIEAIKTGRYELLTNIGIVDGYKHELIHKVTWMSDLLRHVCNNRIRNFELEDNGLDWKKRWIICIIDECESLFTSLRTMDRDVVDFGKFNQLSRKIDLSFTFIFHRFEDVPKPFRDSPNLNAVIVKGMDLEGNRSSSPKTTATIEFRAESEVIYIDGIPKNPILETDETSGFSIYEKKFLDKSVDIDRVLNICQDCKPREVPYKILEYMDTVSIENMSENSLIGICREIETQIKIFMWGCKNKEEYYTLAVKKFEEEFEIDNIAQIKGVSQILKKIINEEWNLDHIEKRKKDIGDIQEINYLETDLEVIKMWLLSNKRENITATVKNNFREYNFDEIKELIDYGIAKTKVKDLYGKGKNEEIVKYKPKLKKHSTEEI